MGQCATASEPPNETTDETKSTDNEILLDEITEKFHKVLHHKCTVDNAESLASPNHINFEDLFVKLSGKDNDEDEKDEKADEKDLNQSVISELEKEFVELVSKLGHEDKPTLFKGVFDAITKFLQDKFGWEIPTNPDEFEDIFVPATLRERQTPNKFEAVEPKTYDELKKMMTELYSEQGLKAMGTEYGWLDVTFSKGKTIDMNKYLKKPSVDINQNILNEYGSDTYTKGNVVCTEAGCTYYDLQKHLWPLDKRRTLYKDKEKGEKYKVFKFIGFDKLSFGGSISCGAQGWGTYTNEEGGSIPNGVRAIHLITFTEDGALKEYIIECSVGNKDNPPIFDETKFYEVYDKTKCELIQDDDTFNCALVSVGTYGIVYAYYFELQDAFFIRELKFVTTWDDFKKNKYDKYVAEMMENKISAWELWVSPYKVKLPFMKKFHDSPPILITIDYFVNDEDEKPPAVINSKNGGGLRGSPWETVLGAILQVLVTKYMPFLAPLVLQMFIENLSHKEPIVLTPMDGASFWSGNDIGNETCGFGVPRQHFWDALEEWQKVMNQITAKNKHYIANGGTFVRFTGPKNRGFLDMYTNCDDEGGFMIEQSCVDFSPAAKPWNAFGASPGWKTIFRHTQDLLMKKYQAGTHWGLWFDKEIEGGMFRNISEEKMKLFVDNYKKFNASKKFCNAFTESIGLDQMAWQ
eukprot:239896_1